MSFTFTPPPPPGMATLISPNGNITDTRPEYRWNQVAGAEWYYLWVNAPSGNGFIKQWHLASNVCTSGICSVTPDVNLSPGNHTWWIRTWNAGGYGPWSAAMSFSLPVPLPPDAAILVSPNGNAGSLPTYSWNQVFDSPTGDAATWYYLWVNTPSENGYIQQWYQAANVCNAGICSVTPNVTLGAGNYTWWIHSWNSAGYGPWSSSMTFSVTP